MCRKHPEKVAYKTRKEAARALQKTVKRQDGRPPPKYMHRCKIGEGGCGQWHLTHWPRRVAKLYKAERGAVA